MHQVNNKSNCMSNYSVLVYNSLDLRSQGGAPLIIIGVELMMTTGIESYCFTSYSVNNGTSTGSLCGIKKYFLHEYMR